MISVICAGKFLCFAVSVICCVAQNQRYVWVVSVNCCVAQNLISVNYCVALKKIVEDEREDEWDDNEVVDLDYEQNDGVDNPPL